MYDVIIVGGGAAGLMAAKLLSVEGKKILLLEAKDKLGGRILRVEDLSFPAEGGAEFIHGKSKTTFNLIREAGLSEEKLKGEFCRHEKGKWNTADNLVPHWHRLLKKLKNCKADTTIDIFLSKHFSAKKYETLTTQFKKYIEGYNAADPARTSVLAIREEMEKEDERQYRPVPDYYGLIHYLQETCFKNGATIKTGDPVKRITINRNIEVETTGNKYNCGKLIIAVPVGILQSRKRQAGFISFPPSMKKYLAAAREIGNGGVIKFLLEFDEAFWLEKKFLHERKIPPPSYIFSDTAIPTWWTQYPSKRPLLTGWVGGRSSFKMKNYSAKKFESLSLQSLSKIFSIDVKQLNVRLKTIVVINWNKDPHFLGAYSYPTIGTDKGKKLLQQPFRDAVYFAGEYVAEDASTVDAALHSGSEVARLILNEK